MNLLLSAGLIALGFIGCEPALAADCRPVPDGSQLCVVQPRISTDPPQYELIVPVTPVPIPSAEITLSTQTIQASAQVGNNPASTSFTVTNTGPDGSTLYFSVASDNSFAAVSPSSGVSTNAAVLITVTFDVDAEPAGQYGATLTIDAPSTGNSPQAVDVEISVTPPPAVPTIGVPPVYEIYSTAPSDPDANVLPIWNAADNGADVNYVITPSDSDVQVSPSTGSVDFYSPPDVLALTFTGIGARGAGDYVETLDVVAAGASNTPQTVTLNIHVAAAPGGGSEPVADIDYQSRSGNCMAPCAVYFDASTSTAPGFSPVEAKLDLYYEWDFDDTGSGTWARGAKAQNGTAQSKDVAYGPWAAHVYETPGTYTPTVTVCNDAGCDTPLPATAITVTDPDAVISSGNTHCFTNGVDTSGCPNSGTVHTSWTDFDQALSSSGGCDVSTIGRRCLFKRGDTFASSGSRNLATDSPGIVGAYGSGAKPIVNHTGYLFGDINDGGRHDWRLMDLTAVGPDAPASGIFNKNGVVKDLLILRIDSTDAGQVLDFYRASNPVHENISVVDSSFEDFVGGSQIGVYLAANRVAWMGNFVGNSRTSTQHLMRTNWSDGWVFAHSELGFNSDIQFNVFKIHNFPFNSAKSVDGCAGNWMWTDTVIDMGLRQANGNANEIMIGHNSSRGEECVEHMRIEGNLFTYRGNHLNAGPQRLFEIRSGEHRVRNNVCDLHSDNGTAANRHCMASLIVDGSALVPPHNTRYENNSCVKQSSGGSNISCIQIGGGITNSRIENNLCWMATGGCIDDNGIATVETTNVPATANPYVVSSGFDTLADFDITNGSQADDAGTPLESNPRDIFNVTRDGTDPDVGAVEE